MDEKVKKRIVLKNDQQTTLAISFARGRKTATEPGDTLLVASSAGTILSARFNPVTGVVDVVPIEGATGSSDVEITATLADGTVMPVQSQGYDIVHPDIESVVLKPGAVVKKTTIIAVPLPNAAPHVVPVPVVEPTPAPTPQFVDASPPSDPPPAPSIPRPARASFPATDDSSI